MEIKGYKPNVDKEHQNHVGSLLDQCGQVQVFLLLSFLIFKVIKAREANGFYSYFIFTFIKMF